VGSRDRTAIRRGNEIRTPTASRPLPVLLPDLPAQTPTARPPPRHVSLGPHTSQNGQSRVRWPARILAEASGPPSAARGPGAATTSARRPAPATSRPAREPIVKLHAPDEPRRVPPQPPLFDRPVPPARHAPQPVSRSAQVLRPSGSVQTQDLAPFAAFRARPSERSLHTPQHRSYGLDTPVLN
jgi:hypothetical protein